VTPDFLVEVFYDGSCGLCRTSRRWVERRDTLRRLRFVDSGGSAAGEACPVPSDELARAVWVRLPGGRLVSGYAAWVAVLRALPRWRLVAGVLELPPMRWAGAVLYRVIARHRHTLRHTT
jgi:predicted DCC family thiol-disulfide oxidoreductase YuxK